MVFPLKLDTDTKPKRKPTAKSVATQLQFHKPELSKPVPEIVKGLRYLPSNISGMNQLFGDVPGYPLGAIFNYVGVPKVGKTTSLAYESLGWAMKGYPVWVMYNESVRDRYMELWNRHRTDLGIDEKTYTHLPIQFVCAFGKKITSRPKYDTIRKAMRNWIGKSLRTYLEKGNKPAAIIFDSLTAFYREWAPQAYVFVEAVVSILHELFYEFKVRPVVFCVSQKASKEWGKNDEQGYGGYGPVHIMDGSIVFSKYMMGQDWILRNTGFSIGTTQRFIKMDVRDVYGSEELHHYTQELDPVTGKSGLYVGNPLSSIINDYQKERGNSNGTE